MCCKPGIIAPNINWKKKKSRSLWILCFLDSFRPCGRGNGKKIVSLLCTSRNYAKQKFRSFVFFYFLRFLDFYYIFLHAPMIDSIFSLYISQDDELYVGLIFFFPRGIQHRTIYLFYSISNITVKLYLFVPFLYDICNRSIYIYSKF